MQTATEKPTLNCKGLAAFDLRTQKPDGSHWDFKRKQDREEARAIVLMLKPKWIVGSPPCESFCTLNRGLNYPKMDPKDVERRIRGGRTHLRFVVQLDMSVRFKMADSLSMNILKARPAGEILLSLTSSASTIYPRRLWTNANMDTNLQGKMARHMLSENLPRG